MANNVTFDQLMQGFGVVTVMDVCLYELKPGKSYVGGGRCDHKVNAGRALLPGDFQDSGLYLDTLKIANLTQEGPTKTITGGQYANPLIKYGKTMTCEMQDALGRGAVMEKFFGCEYVPGTNRLSVGDKFPGAFAMEGRTFFIDQKTGEKHYVWILIPQLLPEAILTLTQDAEGDATVFDLNGTVAVTDIADQSSEDPRSIFYEIREYSWFAQNSTQTDADFYVGDKLYASVAPANISSVEDPEMPGYEFEGWCTLNTDGELEDATPTAAGKYYAKFDLYTKPTENPEDPEA